MGEQFFHSVLSGRDGCHVELSMCTCTLFYKQGGRIRLALWGGWRGEKGRSGRICALLVNKSCTGDDEREHHSPRPSPEREGTGRMHDSVRLRPKLRHRRQEEINNAYCPLSSLSLCLAVSWMRARFFWLGWRRRWGKRGERERVNHYDVVLAFHSVLH